MKRLFVLAAVSLFASTLAPAAIAADPKPGGRAAQQEKMKRCNADAKSQGLKGAERKKFMKECLKG